MIQDRSAKWQKEEWKSPNEKNKPKQNKNAFK